MQHLPAHATSRGQYLKRDLKITPFLNMAACIILRRLQTLRLAHAGPGETTFAYARTADFCSWEQLELILGCRGVRCGR